MELTTLGSGTFFVTEEMSASSSILEIDGKTILIDCGPGTLVKLAQAGYTLQDLDYVFITHFHPDHTSDLFSLFMNFRLNDLFDKDEDAKFPTFYGPEGFEKFMLDYSHVTQLHGFENWGKIEIVEYTPETQIDNITIKSYKVHHNAFGIDATAYSLRFEIEDKVVVFSGDCADCEGIREACKNADLFICDASFPNTMNTKSHMNTTEIGQISAEGEVKKVMLTHFYPQFKDYDLIAEIKEYYTGEVTNAEDLGVMEI